MLTSCPLVSCIFSASEVSAVCSRSLSVKYSEAASPFSSDSSVSDPTVQSFSICVVSLSFSAIDSVVVFSTIVLSAVPPEVEQAVSAAAIISAARVIYILLILFRIIIFPPTGFPCSQSVFLNLYPDYRSLLLSHQA